MLTGTEENLNKSEICYVHGLEGSKLLRHQFSPNWSVNSIQSNQNWGGFIAAKDKRFYHLSENVKNPG